MKLLSALILLAGTIISAAPANAEPGSCSVNIPGCEGYDECHPVVTGNMDCFPEDESCSKPGNTFPWCAPAKRAGLRYVGIHP